MQLNIDLKNYDVLGFQFFLSESNLLNVCIHPNMNLQKYITDDMLLFAKNDYLNFMGTGKNDDTIKGIEEIIGKNEKLSIFKSISVMCADIDKINSFFDFNKFMDNYYVMIDLNVSFLELDKTKIMDFLTKHPKCSILIRNNELPINKDEFIKTMDIIDDICNFVQKYDFSPLEKIMYVYDIVRSRVYVKEGKDDSAYDSRDLSKVLLGDKIVCVGFSNIFSSVLERLGFKTSNVILVGKTSSHQRTKVIVNDEKYNVYGIYNFDATWGCKKSENDKAFLNDYLYFAKTDQEFEKYQKNRNYLNLVFDEDYIVDLNERINKDGIDALTTEDIDLINSISRLIGDNLRMPNSLMGCFKSLNSVFKTGDYSVDEAIDELHNYFKVLNTKIPYDVLINVLYNVRKQQYYENPQKYDYTIDSLYSAVLASDWRPHEFDNLNSTERLYAIVFRESVFKDYEKANRMLKKQIVQSYERDIEGVKLARTLRNYLENNKE